MRRGAIRGWSAGVVATGLLLAACTYEPRCPSSNLPTRSVRDAAGLAVDPQSGMLVVSNANGDDALCSAYLALVDPRGSGGVSRILPAVLGGGTQQERISLLGEVAVDEGRAYVVERTSDSVLAFDLASGTIEARGWTGTSPYGLSLGATASVPIDCHGDRVTGPLIVTSNLQTEDLSVFVGRDLTPAAVRCDGQGNAFSTVPLYQRDEANNRLPGQTSRLPVEVALNPAGPTAYVDYQLVPEMSVVALDPSTWPQSVSANFELAVVPLSSYTAAAGARGLAVSGDGQTVYVATRIPAQLVAVDPSGLKVVGALALDADPGGVAVGPTGMVWVAVTTADEVVGVDAATFRVRGRVLTDASPFVLTYDAALSMLFVGNIGAHTLQAIATGVPNVVATYR